MALAELMFNTPVAIASVEVPPLVPTLLMLTLLTVLVPTTARNPAGGLASVIVFCVESTLWLASVGGVKETDTLVALVVVPVFAERVSTLPLMDVMVEAAVTLVPATIMPGKRPVALGTV